MTIGYRRQFQKQFRRLTVSKRRQANERLRLFGQNPTATILNNHKLKGKYEGFQSINISGDLRAIYKESSNGVVFSVIGTHSELYE